MHLSFSSLLHKVTTWYWQTIIFTCIVIKIHMGHQLRYIVSPVLTSSSIHIQIETIGDAYCVAGGLHKKIDSHAKPIAHMALKMMELSEEVLTPDGKPIKVSSVWSTEEEGGSKMAASINRVAVASGLFLSYCFRALSFLLG